MLFSINESNKVTTSIPVVTQTEDTVTLSNSC